MFEDKRQFFLVWGEGYVNKKPVTVGMEFFEEDNGFSEENWVEIDDLEMAEALTLRDLLCHMSIVRLV